ncbi:hypothetical protein K469DRAFT_726933 [Zopfia rhizophila CBS 207.26]|uniref:Zn(2)-C6 fungal-type domain-containing protein n=1 Tax=Zopfia rhizophila CBS 207.26 TaxID=1314779 RepID=A0A6A6DZD9_9PEZI|nr:hypothetical protein K469DRAFT_726933 [Zopfia rhizophila CBS 207.26]
MLRRNGKPRSCEPCRVSKVRCDHTTPTCQKCQARGITDQCFYHPAPMTKPPGQPREPRKRVVKPRYSETRLPTRDHEALASPLRSPTTRLNDVGTVASHATSVWPTPPESVTRSIQNPPESSRSFYLGSTSYAAVFAEEHPIPDSIHEQPPERMSATPSVLSKGMTGTRYCQIGVGQSIVSKLAPFSLFEKSIKMYFSANKASALVGPLIMSALPQLRIDLEQLSVTGNDPSAAYAEITGNTARPFKVPSSMLASEFHTLFTGSNLRWETLGLILIVAGSNAQFTSPDHSVFTLESGRKIDKDEFIEDMIQTSNDCINLCQVHGAVNDLMVWMMHQNMLVTSNFYGDNYHGVWRRMGDCVSSLYAEGIHCEETFDVPFFLRESRRRIYAATYKSDKTLATFFGRPPMMAGRYSNRKLPLDIDDNMITTSDPEVLNEVLSKLDSDGWNTEGRIWASSWIRLRCQLSVYKERVLELSLAGQTDGDVSGKLHAISDECRQTWEAIPRHLRYDLYDEDVAWSTLEPGIALRMISVYLDYLHTDFQMQRILRRQTQMAVPALLEISMKLLSTVLVFNKQRNQTYGIQRHFPSIILFYCLPSAGVLALELRRCTLENVPLPSSISRADLIRNLSVLISCLEWVILPGDGNHKLCSELNKMLALVLDEVLNYQPPVNESQNGESGIEQPAQMPFFDMPMIDGMEPIPTESEDFLNWLDNANWNNTVCWMDGEGSLMRMVC